MTNPTPHGQVPEALRFTKKPVTIEAIQWTGKNLREVITFTDGPPDTRSHHAGMAWEAYADLVARDGLKIYTLEGKMLANVGDWIIRGVKGEYYPCKPEIFAATYERTAHVQNPAEIEHVAGDVSKNGEEMNMSAQQPVAQQGAVEAAHEGMTVKGDGAAMLGKLMREQRSSRLGVYPDGNPNAGTTGAMRTQQPAPAGVTGWQDMSTAPKDGTRFVARGHNYGIYSETQHVCIAQWFRGCWMEASDWNEASELKYLTEWAPLPQLSDYTPQPATQPAPAAQGYAPEVLDVPDQCPYFGPSPHRDVWLAGWYAARAAKAAESVPAIQGEANVQLDTDSNSSAPGQQRDVAGSVAMGQPMGRGQDQAACDLGAQGDKLLIVAERNIRSFLRSAQFKSESDREAALNCVDVLWAAARAPAESVERNAEPMQPIELAQDGVIRFKTNRMVNDLYEFSVARGFGLNEMARRDYTPDERMQFAQLIGYSVSGYGGLSYVSDESANKADAIAAAIAFNGGNK